MISVRFDRYLQDLEFLWLTLKLQGLVSFQDIEEKRQNQGREDEADRSDKA